MKFKLILINLLLFLNGFTEGQILNVNPNLLKNTWSAYWITNPDNRQTGYDIFHFRKSFHLASIPTSFLIDVTANASYYLFVNGIPVTTDSIKKDSLKLAYQTIDIAPFLIEGKNTVAAQVWNTKQLLPIASLSNQIVFLMQGNTAAEKIANTDERWKVIKSNAFSINGSDELIDGNKYLWNWQEPTYNDSTWTNAKEIGHPGTINANSGNQIVLTHKNDPLQKEYVARFSTLSEAFGITVKESFLRGKKAIKILKNQQVSFILDQTSTIAAYPELSLSYGRNAVIKLIYSDALPADQKSIKNGNTNDTFIADGRDNRKFRPLKLRYYRYINVNIITKDDDLVINDLYGITFSK